MSMDITPIQQPQTLAAAAAATHQRVAQPEKPQPEPSTDEPVVQIDSVLAELTRVSAAMNRRLAFTINEKLGQTVVKVIDTDTDKVIREIPPIELQNVHERIKEVIGLLFDERA